jgi:glycolate oxidase
VQFGGPCGRGDALDLTGVFVGSEGTFGVVTKVWVRITRDPAATRTMLAIFNTVADATQAISRIIGAGIVPAALEMMDQGIIGALEEAFHFGFPLDAGAVLLIEVDGLDCVVEPEAQTITELCLQMGAREVRRSRTEEDRAFLWKCRKQAFGAIGRLAPSCCTQDGVVPRTRLPEILEFIQQTERKHNIQIVNVFHAGDGNIHPILLFDERDAEQIQRVMLASEDILNRCIELGGSVTGEHGIGVEKISFMSKLFTATDLEVMNDVRTVFNPEGLCSPGKLLPTAGGCGTESGIRINPARRPAF